MSGIPSLQSTNPPNVHQSNISFSENQQNALTKLIEKTMFKVLERTVTPSLGSMENKIDRLLFRVEALENKIGLLQPPNINKPETIEKMTPAENTEEVNQSPPQENVANIKETLDQLIHAVNNALLSKDYHKCIDSVHEFIKISKPTKPFHSKVLSLCSIQAFAMNRLKEFDDAIDIIEITLQNSPEGMSKEKRLLYIEQARALFAQKKFIDALEVLTSDESFNSLPDFQYARLVCEAMIYFKVKNYALALPFVNSAKECSETQWLFKGALQFIDEELSKLNNDQITDSSNTKVEETEDLEQKSMTQEQTNKPNKKRASSSSSKEAKKQRV